MRMMLFACCMALLAACRNETNPPVPKNKHPKKDSRYAGILAKCKAITIDTLPVYSTVEGLDSGTFSYKGVLIDSIDTHLFSPEISTGDKWDFTKFFACYSFAIDNGHTGIIVRTPASNEPTSVKLFTIDNERDTIINWIELADRFDKGSDVSEKTSWLYRNKTMNLTAYMWIQETYDHGVENENDTTIDLSNHYYVLDLSKPKYDTINSNAGDLLKTFQAVIRN